jgi:hypothetical protein
MPFFITRHESQARNPRGFTLPFTPERPLFHVHIPKSGGLSVDDFLQRLFPVGATRRLEHHPATFGENFAGLGRHCCYSGHVTYRFRELLPPRTAVMTFLRDPVERAVSAFRYLQSLGREILAREEVPPALARSCDLSLAEFLRQEPEAARNSLGNVQTWMFIKGPTRRPGGPSRVQRRRFRFVRAISFGLCGRSVTRGDLAQARRNLERCEFVGLTDQMPASLRLLCQMCDWPEPEAVPHVNRTPGQSAALDAETRGRLEELTAVDAELYRFGCELFADRLRDVPTPCLPPAPSGVELGFDGPIPGDGWSERAAYPAGYFRWTGRTAWVESRLAGSGGLSLAVDVFWPLHPYKTSELTASVNGQPVPLARTRLGAVDRFEGLVPTAPAADGRYRVTLRVPRTFRPVDLLPGNPDGRELGVAVSRVALGFAADAPALRSAG